MSYGTEKGQIKRDIPCSSEMPHIGCLLKVRSHLLLLREIFAGKIQTFRFEKVPHADQQKAVKTKIIM